METPKITELPQELVPTEHDPFIDDLGRIAITETKEKKEEKEVDT